MLVMELTFKIPYIHLYKKSRKFLLTIHLYDIEIFN